MTEFFCFVKTQDLLSRCILNYFDLCLCSEVALCTEESESKMAAVHVVAKQGGFTGSVLTVRAL